MRVQKNVITPDTTPSPTGYATSLPSSRSRGVAAKLMADPKKQGTKTYLYWNIFTLKMIV